MRRSFDVLWEAMEARRRQVEAGEVPPAHRLEQSRQARRQSRGCPDEEALSGWVDGELRRKSLRRWLMVWHHVRVRRCRACQAGIMALAAATPPVQLRLPWLVPVLRYVMLPLHRVKTPLAWGSSVLVITIGLSLWSFDMHGTFQMGQNRPEAPPVEDTSTIRTDDGEHRPDAQTEPMIWGD